ncbi:metallophosphoesterase family protein [Bacteroidota bacterium]
MGRRIIIGDIHGCLKTIQELMEKKIRPVMEDKLIFVGDYIDRGPDSKGVLDYLIGLKEEGYNMVFIRGNHEEMLIESFSSETFFHPWIYNGGSRTLESFGISQEEYLELPGDKKLPAKYMRFLSHTTYFIELDKAFIVHAGFNFHDDNPFHDLDAMIWSRNFDYDRFKAKGKPVIHGHTPTSIDSIRQTLFNPERTLINIDAGCVYTDYPEMGNLIALDLDKWQLFVQPNIESEKAG